MNDRPWEDAYEDEVWIITYEGKEYPSIYQAGQFRDHGGYWTADSIESARRVWPESD